MVCTSCHVTMYFLSCDTALWLAPADNEDSDQPQTQGPHLTSAGQVLSEAPGTERWGQSSLTLTLTHSLTLSLSLSFSLSCMEPLCTPGEEVLQCSSLILRNWMWCNSWNPVTGVMTDGQFFLNIIFVVSERSWVQCSVLVVFMDTPSIDLN